MYGYYENTESYTRLENKYNVEFRRVIPKKPTVHNVVWQVLSLLKGHIFWEYQVVKEGRVVSTSQVVPKIPIFDFIPKGGWHIGPCRTVPEERGKSFYPLLLQYIMEKYPSRRFFMIIKETNKSSMGGVKKVGFKAFANGYKSRSGHYRLN